MVSNLKKHWFRHLLVVIVVVILVNLGLWQLRRLEQRRALNQEIWAGLNESLTTLNGDSVDPDGLHMRRVSVTGEFDNTESVILRSKNFNGQQGAEIVVPLRIADSEQSVLVNRGWIPLENIDRAARHAYDFTGDVTIEGVAYRSQTRPDSWLAPTDPQPPLGENRLDAWFRVDINRIQQQIDYPLLPIFIEQWPNPDATAPPFREDDLDLGDGPHFGYAIQWFSFAIILIVLYTIFIRQELRREG